MRLEIGMHDLPKADTALRHWAIWLQYRRNALAL
jgi:hypothetical protein